MIIADEIEKLKDLFGLILLNGERYGFSDDVIEEKICKSSFFKDLENGDLFFNRQNLVDIIANVLELKTNQVSTTIFLSRSFWIGELYIRLFLRYHKSFSYLFLYLPIKEARKYFGLYHEMDFTQAYLLFENIESKNTILSLLLKKKNMTMDKLSVLTGINRNSLMKYCQNNKHIYKASLDTVYKLCNVLDTDIKVFIEKLRIFSDSMRFEFDRTNNVFRSYLGYYYACLYVPTIRNGNFKFVENGFVNDKNESIHVISVNDYVDSVAFIPLVYPNSNNNYLIIFIENKFDLSYLKFNVKNSDKFKNIYLINDFTFVDTLNNKEYKINYVEYKSLINRAKSEFKYDFAFYNDYA